MLTEKGGRVCLGSQKTKLSRNAAPGPLGISLPVSEQCLDFYGGAIGPLVLLWQQLRRQAMIQTACVLFLPADWLVLQIINTSPNSAPSLPKIKIGFQTVLSRAVAACDSSE